METVLISIVILAIVSIIVFGICFLAIKDFKFKASADKNKIEVATDNNNFNNQIHK